MSWEENISMYCIAFLKVKVITSCPAVAEVEEEQ